MNNTNRLQFGALLMVALLCRSGSAQEWLAGVRERTSVDVEYLGWWTKGNDVPPLVTTSSDGTVRADAGVLGRSDTSILFGEAPLSDKMRSGGRLTVYHWLVQGEVGLQLTGFAVGAASTRFSATSGGSPILARPFIDANTGLEASELVAFTDPNAFLAGTVSAETTSEIYSFAALFRQDLANLDTGRIDLVLGYRFFRFREGLRIQEDLVSTDTTATLIPLGTTISVFDQFGVENDFHGGEIGIVGEFFQQNRLSISGTAKAAVGNMRKTLRIRGGGTITTPPPPSTAQSSGGLLALPSNIGTYRVDDFAVLPEFGVTVRFQATDRLAFTAGYNLIFSNKIYRTGGQIDRTVDPNQITNLEASGGPATIDRPFPLLRDSSFWLQGFQLGATFSH